MPDDAAAQRPHADTMRGPIPYLAMNGRAGEAADFYARAFGATDLGRMPMPDAADRFLHLQVEINGGALMMTDHTMTPDTDAPPMASGHLQLVVGDGPAWWARAIAAGCAQVMPYEMQFWGDEWGLLRDPFGIAWGIMQPAPEGLA
ncbi:MAG: VOC family protein [Gemmobacter sp.]